MKLLRILEYIVNIFLAYSKIVSGCDKINVLVLGGRFTPQGDHCLFFHNQE